MCLLLSKLNGALLDTSHFNRKYLCKSLACLFMQACSNHVSNMRNDFPEPVRIPKNAPFNTTQSIIANKKTTHYPPTSQCPLEILIPMV